MTNLFRLERHPGVTATAALLAALLGSSALAAPPGNYVLKYNAASDAE